MHTKQSLKTAVTVRLIFAALILIPAYLAAETLLLVDFDNRQLGSYTKAMAAEDFHYSGYTWIQDDMGRAEIVTGRGGAGNALKMLYPANQYGSQGNAMQIRAALSRGVDTAWASYWVKFEEGFDFVKGGKLPGLCGGRCITGGNDADGYNGWSARVMWRRDGFGEQYMYYVTNTGYGDDILFDKVPPKKRFIPGQWHRINTQIIMNTPGMSDGMIRTYFDGELSLERKDILIRYIDTLKTDLFYISTFFGGSDQSWAPSADMYITFDDILVTSRQTSSPYPQALYELSETSGRVPFTVTADLSASLGDNIRYGVNGAPRNIPITSSASLSYNTPGVYDVSFEVGDDASQLSAPPERKIFVLGERDLLCDSAWQAMALKDTLKSGDTLRFYLTIVDTTADIRVGPVVPSANGAPTNESHFFGILRYNNGTFGAIDGNTPNNYVDGMGGGAGTYEVVFVCKFPTHYSLSVREYLANGSYGDAYVWDSLGRRGYATSANYYGTRAWQDRAGVAHIEPWHYAQPPAAGANRSAQAVRATDKSIGVTLRKNVMQFSILTAANTSARIEIFNIKGVLVKRASVKVSAANRKTDLLVSVPSKGIYIYKVKLGDGVVFRGTVAVR